MSAAIQQHNLLLFPHQAADDLSERFHEIGFNGLTASKCQQETLQHIRSEKFTSVIIDVPLCQTTTAATELAREINAHKCITPIVFLVDELDPATNKALMAIPGSTVMSRKISSLTLLNAIELSKLKAVNKKLVRKFETTSSLPQDGDLPCDKGTEPIFLKVGDKYKRINIYEIDFFFAENKMNYAKIGPRNLPTTTQLKVLEHKLRTAFVRCHKKYLVNLHKIEAVLVKEDKLKVNTTFLPIGYVYRKPLLERLNLLS